MECGGEEKSNRHRLSSASLRRVSDGSQIGLSDPKSENETLGQEGGGLRTRCARPNTGDGHNRQHEESRRGRISHGT